MIDREGSPWFVAKDVCDALGIANPTQAVSNHLDADERAMFNIGGKAGTVNIVNESGLYSLILKSRKPEAKAFKKWVTSAVLPAIRKDGAYVMGEGSEAPTEAPTGPREATPRAR